MEVHAHTHTPRKKWTHYLWEFFMLFLAVTLGFFVENQREHLVERRREKQYMRSMLEDLRNDSSTLVYLMNDYYPTQKKWIDSTFILLNDGNKQADERVYYQAFENANFWLYFSPVNRTIGELKNTGNFRIISTKNVEDGIIKYDNTVKEADPFLEDMIKVQNSTDTFLLTILDYKIVSQLMEKGFFVFITDLNNIPGEAKLISHDKTLFAKYRKLLEIIRFREAIVFGIYHDYIKENKILIDLLKKEYHLK
jgi:hypothetical protein